MNSSKPSLSNTKYSDNKVSEMMAAFIRRMHNRGHLKTVKKSGFLSRLTPSEQEVPISQGGGDINNNLIELHLNQILSFLLCRISMGDREWVRLMTNKERRQK